MEKNIRVLTLVSRIRFEFFGAIPFFFFWIWERLTHGAKRSTHLILEGKGLFFFFFLCILAGREQSIIFGRWKKRKIQQPHYSFNGTPPHS